MISRASSSRLNLSVKVPNSNPNWSCSSWNHPVPIPKIARPWLTTSSVVMIFASRVGLRYVLPVTKVPSCTRSVAVASAPSAV